MAFRYKLQSVLDFRKRQEEGKQRELAVINLEHRQISERLRSLRGSLEIKTAEFEVLSRRSTGAHMYKLYLDFIAGCETDIATTLEELDRCEQRIREKQVELQEYVKRRRVLEVHRDRLLFSHNREEGRKERAVLDEAATNLFFAGAR